MKRVMVRYKVKADRAEENVRFIQGVFEDLARDSPAGLRYASFRLDDGVSFVHVASIESDDGGNPLTETAAFRAFQAELKDRCEEPPVAVTLDTIGTYRFLGG